MDRILRNTGAQLQVTFQLDGVATNATGAVSVTIVGADGSTVAATSTATSVGVGTYGTVLAPQSALNKLTATWVGVVSGVTQTLRTSHEIVGNRYAMLAEIRALDGMADTSLFPNAVVNEARSWAEDVIDSYCGVSFAPRYRHEEIDGTGTGQLRLSSLRPLTLVAVTVDGVAETTTGWRLYDDGTVVRRSGTFPLPSGDYAAGGNVEVTYEAGWPEVPNEIRWAARTLARYYALEMVSRIPDRALSVTNEFGNIALAQAGGMGRPTALPDVNAVLNRWRDRPPAVG